MSLKINLQTLNQITIIYVSIQLFLFLAAWIKPYIAIFLLIAFVYAVYTGYFKNKNFEINNLINDKKFIFIILLFSLFWCYFAGIGGLWYQSSDHDLRNAIFRDLINHNWPVYYQTADVAMVYYMGYWLPAAITAKIFLFISQNFSFIAGNIFLLLYSTFGVFLVFSHILRAVKIKKFIKVIIVILMFIFFSGMDIIGVFFPKHSAYMWHIEWWALIAQYSSFTTVLFWVFNQGISAWLLTLMFYNNKKSIENFGIIALLCFFCSPLPFLGLSAFLIIYSIKLLVDKLKTKQIKQYFKCVFSIQNIISVFLITPVIVLFFISKYSAYSNGIANTMVTDYNFLVMSLLTYFFILEASIYLILISKQYQYDLIYYIVFVSLLLCPFIRIGNEADFCTRASIPALMILFIMTVKFLFNNYNFRKYKIRYLVLCLCLVIGSITPIIEFARGINDVIKNRSIFRTIDSIKTFEGKINYSNSKSIEKYLNFITINPEDKIFFKYLAKKRKK